MHSNYRGMTVNERLYESGRIAEFDKAVEDNNEATVRQILEEIDVDKPSIDAIVRERVLHSPQVTESKRTSSSSVLFSLIVLLLAIGFIGILVILYQQKYVLIVGPFIAIVVATVIAVFFKKRRS